MLSARGAQMIRNSRQPFETRGTGKDAATTLEAIAPLPGNDRLNVHVFATVAKPELLKELQPIIRR